MIPEQNVKISSVEDRERTQAEITEALPFCSDDNLSLSGGKIHSLCSGEIENQIKGAWHRNVKDQKIIVGQVFSEYMKATNASVKKIIGWIPQYFKTREAEPVMTSEHLLSTNCCVLASPNKV